MGKKKLDATDDAPRGGKININAWISKDVGEAFLKLVKEHKPKSTKTAHLESALEDYLKRMGSGAS